MFPAGCVPCPPLAVNEKKMASRKLLVLGLPVHHCALCHVLVITEKSRDRNSKSERKTIEQGTGVIQLTSTLCINCGA